MEKHPILWMSGIMPGVFGGTFIVAFLTQFDRKILAAEEFDETKNQAAKWKVGAGLLRTFLNIFVGDRPPYAQVWAETKGDRLPGPTLITSAPRDNAALEPSAPAV